MKTYHRLAPLIILGMLCGYQLNAQYGFPSWPLVLGSYKHSLLPSEKKEGQVVKWTLNASLETIPNALSNRAAPATPGYDNCGNLEFYALHNGITTDSNLFIYNASGTLLWPSGGTANPGTGLNASFADAEIQVIPVPATANKWYIIYNLNVSNDAYLPSKVAYSILTKTGSVWSINSTQRDIPLSTLPDNLPKTYNKGKAVSKLFTNHHYLYLCRRATNVHNLVIDKFNINSTSITHVQNSSTVAQDWWSLTTVGSPIELNGAGSMIAVLSRDQDVSKMAIHFFKTADLTLPLASIHSKVLIKDLLIKPNESTSGSTASNLTNSTVFPNPQLTYFASKMQSIEFSPLGGYLFMCGGGYFQDGYTNLTFLCQIDLGSNTNVSNPTLPISALQTRVQTQEIAGWNNSNYAVYYGGSAAIDNAAYYTRKMLTQLQSSYDGNLYFTKTSCDTLFVIPNPDAILPINLAPHNINLATTAVPNISFHVGPGDYDGKGYVAVLPDQIDGYNYLTNSTVTITSPSTSVPQNSAPIQLTATPTGGIWSGPVSTTGLFTPSQLGPNVISYTWVTPNGPCVGSIVILVTEPVIDPEIDCCDSVSFSPYTSWDDQREGKAITVYNFKVQQSPITHIDIGYYDCSTNTQITGTGTLAYVSAGQPRLFRDNPSVSINLPPSYFELLPNQYQRLPKPSIPSFLPFGTPPNLFQDRITFNVTLPWAVVPQTWCIKLNVHHLDGESCLLELPSWDPRPPRRNLGEVQPMDPSFTNRTIFVAGLKLDPSKLKEMEMGYVVVQTENPKDEIVGGTGGIWETHSDLDTLKVSKNFVQSKNAAMFTLTGTGSGEVLLFVASEIKQPKPRMRWTLFDKNAGVISADTFSISGTLTDVNNNVSELIKNGVNINSIIPNPTTGMIRVNIFVLKEERIKLELFNLTGQLVTTMFEGVKPSGNHSITYDAESLPNGTYLLRLSSISGTVSSTVHIIR